MACNVTFLSDNLVNDAVISLTTGTENAQFPLANIKNEATAVKFRSQENSIVILFDLQQTRTIDTIAIHGDVNSDLGLTSASIKTSLTTDFNGATAIPIALSAEHLMGFEYITSVDHRYVELTLSGSGVYAELSNVFIGQRIEILQNNLSISSFEYAHNDNSAISRNKYGQIFVDKRNSVKSVAGTIEFCTKAEQLTLDEMFRRHLTHEALWMIVDKDSEGMEEGQYKLTTYGYFQSSPRWSAAGGQHYNVDVRITQAG